MQGFVEEIIERAHAGQVDLAGRPYTEHLYAVADMVPEDLRIIAYMHDLVEDTFWTLEDLRHYFSDWAVNIIDCLTRRQGESYNDFIDRVATNQEATIIKLADLEHNMIRSRIPNPTEKDERRWKKYERAHAKLREVLNGN